MLPEVFLRNGVLALPVDPEAAAAVRAWMDGQHGVFARGTDMRGADLAGADLAESWFTDCTMQGVGLLATRLDRCHFEGADLSGAVLTDADLFKADLADAVLVGTRLDGAWLCRTEMWQVDARGADLTGAHLCDTWIHGADLTGARLDGARCDGASLGMTVDDTTTFAGMHGTVLGPLTHVDGATRTELDGEAMCRFLADRGADVTVYVPPGRREVGTP